MTINEVQISLSQARTLAAFETLGGTLASVEVGRLGHVLRYTPGGDAAAMTPVRRVDVTVDGSAFVTFANGDTAFHNREEMRSVLRDLLACGA